LAHGRSTPLPEPSPGTLAAARERAAAVAQRAGVQRIDAAGLARLEAAAQSQERTLAHGRSTPLPEPSPGTLAAARERAAAVAQRAGVQRIDAAGLA
ncbi:hypothetical protein, partial [Xanthobacter autotrophicus]|uniref:hypothetical protein n=1 Tax=Xanthobacter autotrophicus TaxID=280 RepID=UPI0024A72B2E